MQVPPIGKLVVERSEEALDRQASGLPEWIALGAWSYLVSGGGHQLGIDGSSSPLGML
jgi:hypothetical protein